MCTLMRDPAQHTRLHASRFCHLFVITRNRLRHAMSIQIRSQCCKMGEHINFLGQRTLPFLTCFFCLSVECDLRRSISNCAPSCGSSCTPNHPESQVCVFCFGLAQHSSPLCTVWTPTLSVCMVDGPTVFNKFIQNVRMSALIYGVLLFTLSRQVAIQYHSLADHLYPQQITKLGTRIFALSCLSTNRPRQLHHGTLWNHTNAKVHLVMFPTAHLRLLVLPLPSALGAIISPFSEAICCPRVSVRNIRCAYFSLRNSVWKTRWRGSSCCVIAGELRYTKCTCASQ